MIRPLKTSLALALVALTPSCIGARLAELEGVLQGQLAELDGRMDQAEHDLDKGMEELGMRLDEGTISWDEYNRLADQLESQNRQAYKTAVQQAKAQAVASVDETVDAIKSDLESAKATAATAVQVGTKAGAGMLGLGPFGDLAATALASAFGLNTYRNRRRKTRGEVV